MSSLYKNTKDQAAAPAAPSSPTAAKPSGLYAPKTAADKVPPAQSIPLLSDEAKADAKAAAIRAKDAAVFRGQQAGAAAKVAAAGLSVRLAALRQQSVGRNAKIMIGAIAGLAVAVSGGLEWNAHRSVGMPFSAASTIAPKVSVASSVPSPANAAPSTVALAAVVTTADQGVEAPVADKEGTPSTLLRPKSFNPMSPDYRGAQGRSASDPIVPSTVAPVATQALPTKETVTPGSALKPKSFNPMSPNYQRPGATTAPELSAVAPASAVASSAQSVSAVSKGSPAGKVKSFNPMNPNYVPVSKKVVEPTSWEKQNDDAIDAYAARLKANQGH